MSWEFNYRLDAEGNYELVDTNLETGETSLIRVVGPEIAIAFDKESGTMHKHGAPNMVSSWCASTAKALRDAGFEVMADDLVCITGKFPVEEMNKVINNTGYVKLFYRRLSAQPVAEPA